MRSSDSKLAAIQRAYDKRHPEVALMILAGTVRVYTRSPKSKDGWPVADYHRPLPDRTAAAVYVDAYATGKPDGFYVIPAAEVRKIAEAPFADGHVRPVNPAATNMIITPDVVQQYEDAWEFYLAD